MPAVTKAFRRVSSGIRKASPVHSWKIAMNGNVKRSRLRRPKLSIRGIAGNAKRKFKMPNPADV